MVSIRYFSVVGEFVSLKWMPVCAVMSVKVTGRAGENASTKPAAAPANRINKLRIRVTPAIIPAAKHIRYNSTDDEEIRRAARSGRVCGCSGCLYVYAPAGRAV